MNLNGNELVTLQDFIALFGESNTSSTVNSYPITYLQIKEYLNKVHPETIFPNEYVRLDYVESDGSNFFDTKVRPTQDVSFILDAQIDEDSVSSGNHHILSGSNGSSMIILRVSSGGNGYSARWGSDPLTDIPISGSTFSRHKFYCDKGTFRIDNGESIIFSESTFSVGFNMFLFGLNNSGNKTQGTKMKVYSLRINDDRTKHFYVPAIRKADGVVGFYDYVSKTFSIAEGNPLTPGRPVVNLPKDYIELDYVENDGTQYIDTGIPGDQTTRARGKFYILSNDNAGGVSGFVGYGAYVSSQDRAFGCFSWDGNLEVNFGYSYIMTTTISVDDIIEIDQNKNVTTIVKNGERLNDFTFSNVSFTTPYNLYLMGHNGATPFAGKTRCYYFDLFKSGKVIRSFIPAKRVTDSTVGFYELLSDTFYSNSGTGELIAGSEQNDIVTDLDNRVLTVEQAANFHSQVMGEPAYIPLKYIESTGSQYINTNYIPKTNTRIVLDIQATNLDQQWCCFYGERNSSLSQQFALYSNNGQRYRSNFGPDAGIYAGTPTTDRIIIDQNGPTLHIDDELIATHPDTTLSPSDSLFLLASNTSGRIELPLSAKVYSCKLYSGENLEYDFVPVKNRLTGEMGLLNKITNIFYSNYGSGAFIGGPQKVYIPPAYTQLEYIQSNGSQYILTDYYPNQDTRIECAFMVDSIYAGIDQNYQPIFGSSVQYNERAFEFWSQAYGFTVYGNQEFITNTGVVSGKKCLVDKNKNTVRVNGGTTYSFTYETFTAPLPLAIFATNRVNQGIIPSQQGANLKIYSFVITEHGTTLYNFIPVKDNDDGSIGLYDTVSKTLYSNSGTGAFIPGPSV